MYWRCNSYVFRVSNDEALAGAYFYSKQQGLMEAEGERTHGTNDRRTRNLTCSAGGSTIRLQRIGGGIIVLEGFGGRIKV